MAEDTHKTLAEYHETAVGGTTLSRFSGTKITLTKRFHAEWGETFYHLSKFPPLLIEKNDIKCKTYKSLKRAETGLKKMLGTVRTYEKVL